MRKISDWKTQKECEYCGVVWEIEKIDLNIGEMENPTVVGIKGSGDPNIVVTTETHVCVEWQNCGEDISFDEEEIPTLILEKLEKVCGEEFHDHEQTYAIEN